MNGQDAGGGATYRLTQASDRPRFAAASIAFLCGALAVMAAPSSAARAELPCPVPDDLALHDISLPAARREVADSQSLIVLTFGGVHIANTDPDPRAATYPGRLEADLRAALPGVNVTVTNTLPPGKTSADVPAALPDLIAKTGARLVIWGPGSRDAAAKLDLAEFRAALTAGIEAIRKAGADIILLDTTFVPSPARMAMIEAYRQALLAAAATQAVPLLHRHDMMRLWSEDGTLNLAVRDPGDREVVARHFFACEARALAAPIAAAVRPGAK